MKIELAIQNLEKGLKGTVEITVDDPKTFIGSLPIEEVARVMALEKSFRKLPKLRETISHEGQTFQIKF